MKIGIIVKYITIIALLMMPLLSVAENVWHESTIRTIYPLGSGAFVIIPVVPAPDCTRSDSYLYVSEGENGVSAEAVKNMLSVSLTAATLGKNIKVNYNKNSTSCFISKLQISF